MSCSESLDTFFGDCSPFFFVLLDSVSPIEIVAHRIIWSLIVVIFVLIIGKQWRAFTAAFSRRNIMILGFAAIFLSINWLVYVYAVSSNQVVQASLGYFVNPLISVAMGVIILKERLRLTQWVAVGIALIAVVVLTIASGSVPWIALTLGITFGTYGLLKKFANLPALHSLGIETAVLFPVALIILGIAVANGTESFVLDRLKNYLPTDYARTGNRHSFTRIRWRLNPHSSFNAWDIAIHHPD